VKQERMCTLCTKRSKTHLPKLYMNSKIFRRPRYKRGGKGRKRKDGRTGAEEGIKGQIRGKRRGGENGKE